MIAVLIMKTATHNKDCDNSRCSFYEDCYDDHSPYYGDRDHLFSHSVTPIKILTPQNQNQVISHNL